MRARGSVRPRAPGAPSLRRRVARYADQIEPRSDKQEIALLTILVACGEKAIGAFQASDNPVDAEFLKELERVIERSRQELAALAERSPTTPS